VGSQSARDTLMHSRIKARLRTAARAVSPAPRLSRPSSRSRLGFQSVTDYFPSDPEPFDAWSFTTNRSQTGRGQGPFAGRASRRARENGLKLASVSPPASWRILHHSGDMVRQPAHAVRPSPGRYDWSGKIVCQCSRLQGPCSYSASSTLRLHEPRYGPGCT